MFFLLTISVCMFFLLLLGDFFFRKRLNEKVSTIPGPTSWPLFGNVNIFKPTTMNDLINHNALRYGKVFRLWIFYDLNIIVADAKVVEAILSSPEHIRKHWYYEIFKAWLGDCTLVSIGQKWIKRRKAFVVAFPFNAYSDYVRVFDKQTTILVDHLKRHCEHGPFEIAPYILSAALDIIAEISMGVELNTQSSTKCEYGRAFHGMVELLTTRSASPILIPDLTFGIFAPKMKKQQDEYIEILQRFAENNIVKRKKLLEKSRKIESSSLDNLSCNLVGSEAVGMKRRPNPLDWLLQSTESGQPISNKEIRHEIDALTFAGHHTTTNVLVFTMYCLSRYPDIQKKVFGEIRQVIGDDLSIRAGPKELNELKYLENVFKETMRIYSPVKIIGRRIDGDIQVGSVTIPAHSSVMIPISLIHKDPNVFPDPESFIPERFASDNGLEKLYPYSFLAFSAGPRDCAARKFAMLEIKSMMTMILRHLELLPIERNAEVELNLSAKSMNSVRLKVKPRVYD